MTTFGARPAAAIAERGPALRRDRPARAALLQARRRRRRARRFALTVVDAVAHVSVVKPQSAFYNGSAAGAWPCSSGGRAVTRAAGALVLLDVKRGDIGSTSQAYADATSTRPRRWAATR